ncbi:MAG: ATP-binding cassette domain-containing protein, partial [Pseudomonadota bacterium]
MHGQSRARYSRAAVPRPRMWWASGAGKSTLMRMIYGNYLAQSGSIRIGDIDLVQAAPR